MVENRYNIRKGIYMKKDICYLLLLAGLFCLPLYAKTTMNMSALPELREVSFVHPGLLHNQAELDFIKRKVQAEEEPWLGGWKKLLEADVANTNWQFGATADVVRGGYNRPDIGASDLEKDASAAYAQSIQWVVTGETRHALKAIAILNDWASTLKSIRGHDAKLFEAIGKSQPEGWHIQHTSWGTLLYAGLDVSAETTVNVSTLAQLREAVQKSDRTIVLKRGCYTLTDLPDGSRNIPCSGSNNTIDLSGVYVNVPVGATRRSYITISGNNNTFKGGTFEDIYKSGLKEVTDFSSYNQNRATLAKGLRGSAVLGITGDNNRVVGTKLTVRGSFPYGYGSIYGIGSDNVYGLDKRCAIVIKGKSNTIDGCEIQQRAFGHGIYMQKPANKTVIKNCLVEGRMRPSKDLYLETAPKDLPARSKYRLPRRGNKPIPKDVMLPLSEDGIRVYTGGGSVTVENCTVKKMRGGIRVYLASHATVSNSTAIDCGNTNFNLPGGGKITGSVGNFAYAPLSDFRLSKSKQDIELTILPSPHAVGSHHIADILGSNHNIIFHRDEGPIDTDLRLIVVKDDNSTIRNETEYPIILESSASGNTVVSFGKVTDNGTNNRVSHIDQID